MAGDRMEKPYEPCKPEKRVHVFEGDDVCHCGAMMLERIKDGKFAVVENTKRDVVVSMAHEEVVLGSDESTVRLELADIDTDAALAAIQNDYRVAQGRITELNERLSNFTAMFGSNITARELQKRYEKLDAERVALKKKLDELQMSTAERESPLARELFIRFLADRQSSNAVVEARDAMVRVMNSLREAGGLFPKDEYIGGWPEDNVR